MNEKNEEREKLTDLTRFVAYTSSKHTSQQHEYYTDFSFVI